jgi:DNA-3-methyladenine glycosylase
MEHAPAHVALPESFFDRTAEEVARDLLGVILETTFEGERAAGRIVETEAYPGPHDTASHAAARIGRTRRNDPMFGAPGTAYIYRIYGLHWCFNVVTGAIGYPAAVLVRALEPLAGLEVMRGRRGGAVRDRDLASGPGKLAEALAITGELNRHPLHEPPLRILAGYPVPDEAVARGPRIGISSATESPLRFYLSESPWISR